MDKQKVISRKNFPIKSPLVLSCVVYLMLEHFHASDLAYGIFATLLALVWIVFFVQIFKEDQIDILGNKNDRS